MTSSNYWSELSKSRMARRRVLRMAAAGGSALAAIAVVGCGNDGTAGAPASGLLTKPTESASTRKGGTYVETYNRDVETFDFTGTRQAARHATYAYSRLVKNKTLKFPEQLRPVAEGDAASSWEVSPDGLKYTFTLRPNQKFDPRPPTRGRALNAQDVKFSWDRFVRLGAEAQQLAAKVKPSAPILGIEAPDARTVVVNLQYPYAPLLTMLSYYGYFSIMPVEADGGFDPKKEMLGSAAWRLKEFVPSQRTEFVANPDWYDASRVNFEAITLYLVSEYATGDTQLRSRQIATYPIVQDQIIATKRGAQELLLFEQENFPLDGRHLKFGQLPDSMFLDERVRQAFSMSFDRETIITAFNNVDNFKKEGLPVDMRINSAFPPGTDAWLDPTSSEMGKASKFYKYDPKEAKTLLQAAGHTSPIKVPFLLSGDAAGPEIRETEAMVQMLRESGGFDLNITPLPFLTEFRPTFYRGYNQWRGVGWASGLSVDPDVDIALEQLYRPGVDLSGWPKDSQMDSLIDRQKRELDPKRRIELLKDLQRYVGEKLWMITPSGSIKGFKMMAPWVGNAGVYRSPASGSPANEMWTYLWHDSSKA